MNSPDESIEHGWSAGYEPVPIEPHTPSCSAIDDNANGPCQVCGGPVVMIGWEETSQYSVTVHRHEVVTAFYDEPAYGPVPARMADLLGDTIGPMDFLLGPLATPGNAVGTDERCILEIIVTAGSEPPAPEPELVRRDAPLPERAPEVAALLARCREAEWNGGDVVQILTEWFPEHGYPDDPDAPVTSN